MKIAYLFSRYPVPSQTFCDTEIRALEAAGHEIEIYVCSAPTTSFRHGAEDWPRAEILYAPPKTILECWEQAARADNTWPGGMVAEHEARFGSQYDPARRARHALYFADRLRRRGVEHLHVHFANRATHAALFIHALTGVPFSFTAHAQDFLVDLRSDELLRLMCEKAAFVVAVSDWSRRALVERCPDAAAKIHRVYNGLPLDRWPATPAPSTRAAGPLKIFSVGRLIEFKGFADLVAACRLLRARGVPFCCEIAGTGPLAEPLATLVEDFRTATARVELLGQLSQAEVRARLENCDVFALACRVDDQGACDVLPTVILEAMAAGRPVVSTHLAGVPEMVCDGETGDLVPPGDPAALADALARLATDPEARRRMGAAGRSKLEAQFSSADSARQLGGLFVHAAPAVSRSAEPGPFHDQSPTVFLFDRWPMSADEDAGAVPDAAVLAEVLREQPGAHFVALQPGSGKAASFPAGGSPEATVLRAFDFLPDDLVFETYWRQPDPTVHRLESARQAVGGACSTDTFLLAARRALYLRHWLEQRREKWRGPHAVGPQALLCLFLLHWLAAVDRPSFFLPAAPGGGTGLANSTLRLLAPAFRGGWVAGERKLAASLGLKFRGDKPTAAAWRQALDGWTKFA